MINICRSAFVVILGLVLFATAAMASDASVRSACMNDAKKFCGSVIEQDQARRSCMSKYRSKLSRSCRIAVRNDLREHLGPRPRRR
jgi:DNA-binding ferritin-like protein (Dps family)